MALSLTILNILDQSDQSEATQVVYRVMRSLLDRQTRWKVEETPQKISDAVQHIVDEISRLESQPVDRLEAKRAEQYVTELGDYLRNRTVKPDPIKTGELLDEMRIARGEQERGGRPLIRKQATHLTINKDGDCQALITGTIEPVAEPQYLVLYWIGSDSAVVSSDDLQLSAKCDSNAFRASVELLKNEPTDRNVAVRFEPPVPVGTQLAYELSWRWARMFVPLTRGEEDFWVETIRSLKPVESVTISFSLDLGLPPVQLRTPQNVKGSIVSDDSDDSIKGYRRIVWQAADVQPGTQLDLRLVPTYTSSR
jgi:hypothetical protein